MPGIDAQMSFMDELDGADYGDEEIVNAPVEEDNDAGTENQEDDDAGQDDNKDNAGDGSNTDPDEQSDKEPPPVDTNNKPVDSKFKKVGNSFVDDKNNIVDPRTGAIIARAGSERRMYEKVQRTTNLLNDAQTRLAEYEKQHSNINTLFGKMQQEGITHDEAANAFQMAIEYKRQPLEVAKKILADVLAMGHNVSDVLGSDASNAIEISGINKLIEDKLKPIIEPLNQQREQEQQIRQAQLALDKWVNENEYADIHLSTIDALMGKNPDLTIQQAYNSLLIFANKHGLDFSQPLDAQIKARQTGANNKPSTEKRIRKPMVTGSRVEPSDIEDKNLADPNASWKDILRSVMPN